MLQKLKDKYHVWLYGNASLAASQYETEETFEPAPSHINIDPHSQPRGHVIRTTPPEYTPNQSRTGGRVVKTMPRQLRKIKEAQEKVAADD